MGKMHILCNIKFVIRWDSGSLAVLQETESPPESARGRTSRKSEARKKLAKMVWYRDKKEERTMCYAIPAKLIERHGHRGVVDYFGEHREILLDDDAIAIGEYLYAQGGIMVRRIPHDEAKEILSTWKEIFFELKKVDESLSSIDAESLSSNALHVLQKVNLRKSLTKDELLTLFGLSKEEELGVVYEIANNVRHRCHGNASCVHGIIEFSNYCQHNCHYCGIRNDKPMARYRMTPDDIIAAAYQATIKHGFKAVVLQSGEDYWYDDDTLADIVTHVRSLGVLVFISIGSRGVETYQKLYAAGARAALLRFETSNDKIFSQVRPGTSLTERISLIREIQAIGYILATGFIVGLPGETDDDIINNILLTKALAPDMYSFGPFIPANDTPLSTHHSPTIDTVLKTIALSRLVDPNANILITTALETLGPANVRHAGLRAGANSMMINLTPPELRQLYSIYDNRANITIPITTQIDELVTLLKNLGRAPTDVS